MNDSTYRQHFIRWWSDGRRVRVLGRTVYAPMAAWWLCQMIGAMVVAAEARPNILFIFSDDHAVQAISAYGSVLNQTPHIDRLAKEGMLCRNSFCANSICGPSRASILTGLHSHLNGMLRNGNDICDSRATFPVHLQAAGYHTALFGKWHLGTSPQGFDAWEVLPDQGHYYNPDFLGMDGRRQRYEGYCTDIITEKSLTWLRQRDQSKPFLLMVQHKAPHRNWSPAPRHFRMFDGTPLPAPPTLQDDYSGRSNLLAENEMSIAKHLQWAHDMKLPGENVAPQHFTGGMVNDEYRRMTPSQRAAWDAYYGPLNQDFITKLQAGKMSSDEILQWKYQRYVTDYLKCIAAVDDSVGKLLDFLDQSGLAANTVVVYASDQGFYLGEHGWYDKRWMFEESLKMPLLVRWPGHIPAGAETTSLVQNIDYAPTFLELAGLPVPNELQGQSLMPVWTSNKSIPDWRDAIYYAYYENAAVHHVPVHDGIRTARFKLMWFPRSREWQLFDLTADPHELQSQHANPEYANILRALQKRYHDLRQYYRVNTAIIPITRGDEPWWRDRDQEKLADARKGNIDLAFVGDSITQGWEDAGRETWNQFYAHRKPINLGFSGDRTEHVLWRLQHGEWAGFQPKATVIMIGTNNTGHAMQRPEEVVAGVTRIVDLIREKTPQTRILLLGIFPRGNASTDDMRLNNVAINQYLRQMHDGEHVVYRDIGHIFLEPDGTIDPKVMPDALHLSPEGYRRWANAIEPQMVEWGL